MKNLSDYINQSGDQLLSQRTKNFTQAMGESSRSYIEKKKAKFRELQDKLEQHLDLGVTNTTDLGSALQSINKESWISNFYQDVDSIVLLRAEINVAISKHNILFPKQKIEELGNEELAFLEEEK